MPENLLSVILLSYFSGGRLQKCYEGLTEVLGQEGIPFELVIIDDGSTDASYDIALGMERSYPNVRAFQLSRNYTSHYSIFAGLSVCKGKCTVPIPDDEQFPYICIVEMYRIWEKGSKIIIPQRKERKDPPLSNIFSNSFYKLMNSIADVKFPKGGADSFFIDREIIDIINQRIRPVNTSTITEILRLGYSPVFHPFYRPESTNRKSRWTFKKKWKLAKDLIYSSTSFPIKLIINSGLFFFVVSLLLVISFITIKIFNIETGIGIFNVNVQGWTSLITAVTFFGGLILLSLGVIAEYIFRIYEEVKDRPGFIIKEKNDRIRAMDKRPAENQDTAQAHSS